MIIFSFFFFIPCIFYDIFPIVITTLNLSEIEKQQQELEKRAAELDRREQNLNAPAGSFGMFNIEHFIN